MVLETAQLLSSAVQIRARDYIKTLYKPTHLQHPCTVWATASATNLQWLTDYGLALAQEYSYRYNRTHASLSIIERVADMLLPRDALSALPLNYAIAITDSPHKGKFVPLDLAISEYRSYYNRHKLDIARYANGRLRPEWLNGA